MPRHAKKNILTFHRRDCYVSTFSFFPLCIIHDARRHITRNWLFLLRKNAEKAESTQKRNRNRSDLLFGFCSSSFRTFLLHFPSRLVPLMHFGVRFRGNCVFGSIVLLQNRFLVFVNENARSVFDPFFVPSNLFTMKYLFELNFYEAGKVMICTWSFLERNLKGWFSFFKFQIFLITEWKI